MKTQEIFNFRKGGEEVEVTFNIWVITDRSEAAVLGRTRNFSVVTSKDQDLKQGKSLLQFFGTA